MQIHARVWNYNGARGDVDRDDDDGDEDDDEASNIPSGGGDGSPFQVLLPDPFRR
jgi:hypothetical protein